MLYRKDKYQNEISQLGYGCMRFTKKGASIDYEKAESEVLYAIKNGVNYFDTAYVYMGIEETLGKILANNKLREKVYIATKLPQYITRSMDAVNKIFAEELRRLQTDYIDYYLFHMFTDYSEWERLESLGIRQWIEDHKKDSSIKNIGFSYHGEREMFLKILNAYDWDFCQIQYNYLDEYSQAGKTGLKAAAEKGIPVIIMEPLRGGRLVNIPDKAKKKIAENDRGYSPAEWGLRWLWNQPEVTCVLSGMNSADMVKENIRAASEAEAGSFTKADFALIEDVKQIICRYCMPCPKGVDIPGTFYYYNLMYMEAKKYKSRFEFAQNIGIRKTPGFATQCIGCGKCEQHCPQKINIREKLVEADRKLRPLPYKIGINVARKFMIK